VRVDTHCAPGHEVSPRYDSLLAKVIVSDRPRAADPAGLLRVAALAGHALATFEVAGTRRTWRCCARCSPTQA